MSNITLSYQALSLDTENRLINVNLVHREKLEITQTRVSSTKVIHGYGYSQRLYLQQQTQRRIGIIDQHTFDDFQL